MTLIAVHARLFIFRKYPSYIFLTESYIYISKQIIK